MNSSIVKSVHAICAYIGTVHYYDYLLDYYNEHVVTQSLLLHYTLILEVLFINGALYSFSHLVIEFHSQ